jgi:hypothetical protein
MFMASYLRARVVCAHGRKYYVSYARVYLHMRMRLGMRVCELACRHVDRRIWTYMLTLAHARG